jgi:hypothetical protein
MTSLVEQVDDLWCRLQPKMLNGVAVVTSVFGASGGSSGPFPAYPIAFDQDLTVASDAELDQGDDAAPVSHRPRPRRPTAATEPSAADARTDARDVPEDRGTAARDERATRRRRTRACRGKRSEHVAVRAGAVPRDLTPRRVIYVTRRLVAASRSQLRAPGHLNVLTAAPRTGFERLRPATTPSSGSGVDPATHRLKFLGVEPTADRRRMPG